jgi:DNA-binding response OmpR family regulator
MPNETKPTGQSDGACLVLIADDDIPTRMLLRAAVSQWGYKTIEASDGEEAWEILKSPNPPELLILDWLMPKLDGIALCERMQKELPYHPYTILLTQLAGTTNISKALDAGADEFLSKPFNMAELHNRLSIGKRILGYQNSLLKKNTQLDNYAKQSNISNAQLLTLLGQLVEKKGGKISIEEENPNLRITIELPSEPESNDQK